MNKFAGVLILFFTGSLLMGCGILTLEPKPNVQQSTIGIPGQCSSLNGSAVTVTAFYGDVPTPLTGLNIRYRVNGEGWQDLPETTTPTTPIIGPAGTYNIEIRKESYPLQTAVVFVPQDEGCSIMEQNLEVTFHHPASCPPPPQVIILDVIQPHISDGLSIQVEMPTGETPTEQCQNGQCMFNLQTQSPGNYNVVFVGFPDQREMYLENYVVHYSYMDVEIHVRVGDRTHQIVTEGVDNINLIIPFDYGDSGCLEVLFNQIRADRTHFQVGSANMVETREERTLRVADISSGQCVRSNVQTVVEYDVVLPAGTALTQVTVEYWFNGNWVEAMCDYKPEEKKFICQGLYENPLFGDSYNIRTIINDKEYIGTYISLDNKCIYFE